MNVKTTLALVIVLVVIGILWFFAPAREAGPEAESTEPVSNAPRFVFDPQPELDALTRIEVQRPERPTLVFAATKDTDAPAARVAWRLVEPVDAPAEVPQVTALARTLLNLQYLVEFTPGSGDQPTLAEAGLDPPTATVIMVEEDGQEHVVQIGGQVVMSTDTYVCLGDQDKIYVASRDLLPQVRKDLSDYRSKRLFDFKPEDVAQAVITQGDSRYDLTRQGDQDWVLNEPVRAHAAADQVKILLRNFSSLRATDFVPADVSGSALGFDNPYLTFEVTTEQRHRIIPDEPTSQPAEPEYETITDTYQIVVGAPAGLDGKQRYARRAGADWAVTVGSATLENLLPDLDKLRDPRVLRIKASDVTALEIASADQTARLEQIDGRWQSTTADLGNVESSAVIDVLNALEALQAVSFIDAPGAPSEYGLAAPRATLSVQVRGSVEPIVVHVGSATGSGQYAYLRLDDQEPVIVVGASQADRLLVTPIELRSRVIFSVPPADLRNVVVQSEYLRYELGRPGDAGWKLVIPVNAPLAVDNANALVANLARLRARSIAGRFDEGGFGLDAPALVVSFDYEFVPPPEPDADEGPPSPEEEPAEPILVGQTLTIGRVDDRVYARRAEEPYVFELDQSVYRTLSAELIDPAVFDFGAGDVVAVTMQFTDEELELRRGDDGWEYVPEPFLALDQKQVEDLVQSLAGLTAERYRSYRGADAGELGLSRDVTVITIELTDGRTYALRVGSSGGVSENCLALLVAEGRAFELAPQTCDKLVRGLGAYLPAE